MVKQTDCIVEIEPDSHTNASLMFLPIGRKVRGRFDWRRVREPRAAMTAAEWPEEGIPGQRLGITADGTGYIVEPLHDAPLLKEKIEQRGQTLPPAREEFAGVHIPTWLFWLKRAAESGVAKVTRGELPEKIDGRPRTKFFANPAADPRDKVIEALVEVVAELLPPNKRAKLKEAMG